jgi:hypothetical protein
MSVGRRLLGLAIAALIGFLYYLVLTRGQVLF